MQTKLKQRLAIMAGLCISLAIMNRPVFAAEPSTPQISKDGLQLVKQTKARLIYKRPGATFTQFKRVAITDCAVDFSKSWIKEYNSSQRDLSRRIKDSDLDRAKTYLSAQFKKIFTEELAAKGGYEIAEQGAPDVLTLRPALVNIRVSAPDLMSPARATYVQESGQMTLYLELWDPSSNTILARIVDARGSNETRSQRSNAVSNKVAADTLMEGWAKELHERLDFATGKTNEP